MRLSGEFDITSIDAFRKEMALVKESAPEEVVLDLQALSFMDSTGIRMILSAQAELESERGDFSIIPGPARVMRVLEIAGVDTRLKVYSSNGSGSVPQKPKER